MSVGYKSIYYPTRYRKKLYFSNRDNKSNASFDVLIRRAKFFGGKKQRRAYIRLYFVHNTTCSWTDKCGFLPTPQKRSNMC